MDNIKNVVEKCEDAIEKIENGCIDTSTGILKKIVWIKDDTKNVEFCVSKEEYAQSLCQKIKNWFQKNDNA